MFVLDSRLQKDTHPVANLPLCELLLMNDSQYPWLILVPRRVNLRELVDLDEHDQLQLTRESNVVAQLLLEQVGADKLNIAALGNIVAQLHVHHIARFAHDPVWPAPVWGALEPVTYTRDALAKRQTLLREGLHRLAPHWRQ